MSLRVLGIDPGTAVTGYGVVEPAPTAGRPGRLVECGIIRTNSREKIWSRLEALYEGVSELIVRHRPTAVAIESVFYGKNARSTLTLGHARGVVLLAAARAGLEIAEFAPAAVKKSVVGGGGAAKAQVAYMVQQLLRLKRAPAPSDAADGVAVALTYLMTRRHGQPYSLPPHRQEGQNGQPYPPPPRQQNGQPYSLPPHRQEGQNGQKRQKAQKGQKGQKGQFGRGSRP